MTINPRFRVESRPSNHMPVKIALTPTFGLQLRGNECMQIPHDGSAIFTPAYCIERNSTPPADLPPSQYRGKGVDGGWVKEGTRGGSEVRAQPSLRRNKSIDLPGVAVVSLSGLGDEKRETLICGRADRSFQPFCSQPLQIPGALGLSGVCAGQLRFLRPAPMTRVGSRD